MPCLESSLDRVEGRMLEPMPTPTSTLLDEKVSSRDGRVEIYPPAKVPKVAIAGVDVRSAVMELRDGGLIPFATNILLSL